MNQDAQETMTPYKDFTNRLSLLIAKNPELITITLSNIFTMRLIGNKTHGDLAEIAISEFINQYMYDFSSVHVGKDLFRAKSKEEDIKVINEVNKAEVPISLKAYGDGPLQLSTDKTFSMFPRLLAEGRDVIDDKDAILGIFEDHAFLSYSNMNVMPLIYDERKQKCNILVFDYSTAKESTASIVKSSSGKGRKHPVFRFLDDEGGYICEVRYGNATSNALQRGLWTHTKNALKHFDSITNGWIDYSHNPILVKLFSHALVSSNIGHKTALAELIKDIDKIRKVGLK